MKNVIVILNYNDVKTTRDFINRISDYDNLSKIIVVDNCSPDNSYEYLKILANKKIDVIQTTGNDGYASGNNFGVKYALDKYEFDNVIISNPDIIVEDNSIKNMAEFLENHPKFSAVSGLVHSLEGEVVKNFAWKQPTYLQLVLSSSLVLNKLSTKLMPEYNFYDRSKLMEEFKEVGVLSGCFFMIRKEVFESVGLFDESTFLFHEENILFYKLNQRGYKQAVLIDEKVIHFEGVSISKNYQSYLSKAKILKQSMFVYTDNYLMIGSFKKKILDIVFSVGTIEKYIHIKRINKNVKRKRL